MKNGVSHMEKYIHRVQYYETDRMGVTHHSNYIRWMEEARIDYLDRIGCNYAKMEEMGIISPVTSVECKYKHSTTFSDDVYISVGIEEFNGVRMRLKYIMENSEGNIIAEAYSEHCFIKKNGQFIKMNKDFPELYNILKGQI